MRVKYDMDTKLFVQIGDPLENSTGAYLHNIMYDMAYQNAINFNVLIPDGDMQRFMDAARVFNIAGIDVTMPYKSAILPYLDECEELARAFSCVNHVKVENGKFIGVGWDGVGMRMAIEHMGIAIAGRQALIIGAGDAASLIAAEMCKAGISSLVILNRSLERAQRLKHKLGDFFATPVSTDLLNTKTLDAYAASAELLIQCTSLGMVGLGQDFPSVGFVSRLPAEAAVADVIFNPPRSQLIAAAEDRGLTAINGLGMYVQQQKLMAKFHFDIDLDDRVLAEAEEAIAVGMTLRQMRQKRLHAKG